MWQQDSTLCHVSNCSLQWLNEHTHNFISEAVWPPSSPYLNPIDNFFCGALEACTNRAAHSIKASFINSIKEEAIMLEKGIVEAACIHFRGYMEAVMLLRMAKLNRKIPNIINKHLFF